MLKKWVFLLLCLLSLAAQAQDKACAAVLLHGKWGAPQNMSLFANRIDPPCSTKSLEMPWASRRAYDESYPAALAAIGAQVAAFRAQGYRKVVIAGQSFGANAVVAYLAEGGDADAAIVMAPGHAPKFMYEQGLSKPAVDKARELVGAGKGSETLSIMDLNQDQKRSMSMRADVLLTYFEPTGLGDIPSSAARVKRALPVLWVTPQGNAPPMLASYGFEQLPADPKSRFVQVGAGHMGVPDAAGSLAQDWLKTVLAP